MQAMIYVLALMMLFAAAINATSATREESAEDYKNDVESYKGDPERDTKLNQRYNRWQLEECRDNGRCDVVKFYQDLLAIRITDAVRAYVEGRDTIIGLRQKLETEGGMKYAQQMTVFGLMNGGPSSGEASNWANEAVQRIGISRDVEEICARLRPRTREILTELHQRYGVQYLKDNPSEYSNSISR